MEHTRLSPCRSTIGEAIITAAGLAGFLALLWQNRIQAWSDVWLYVALLVATVLFYFALLLARAVFLFMIRDSGETVVHELVHTTPRNVKGKK